MVLEFISLRGFKYTSYTLYTSCFPLSKYYWYWKFYKVRQQPLLGKSNAQLADKFLTTIPNECLGDELCIGYDYKNGYHSYHKSFVLLENCAKKNLKQSRIIKIRLTALYRSKEQRAPMTLLTDTVENKK